jgi:Membrane protein involved in the export of O-antigen and teichoic acid
MLTNILILEFKCKIFSKIKFSYFDRQLFKEMMRFSLPLCVNSIAFWFLNSANKLIVTTVLGAEYNGYFAVAGKFTSIIYLISSAFQLAWQELAFSKENKINEKTGKYYGRAVNLYSKFLLCALALVIPLIKLGLTIYPNFIDSGYHEALKLIPLALAGTIMSVLSSFLGSIFAGIKKNNVTFISNLTGAIVNLALIYLIIRKVGVASANISFLVGFSAAVFMRALVLKKLIGLKFKYVYFVAAVPVIAGLIYIYGNLNWIYNLGAFFLICAVSVFLFKNEISDIIKEFKIRINK